MALERVAPEEAASSASAEMVGRACESVVQVQSRARGPGAGMISAKDGLVLTNHHAVAGARRGTNINVVLHDGRAFDADVVKCGQNLDLALLRIKGAPAVCRPFLSATPTLCASVS